MPAERANGDTLDVTRARKIIVARMRPNIVVVARRLAATAVEYGQLREILQLTPTREIKALLIHNFRVKHNLSHSEVLRRALHNVSADEVTYLESSATATQDMLRYALSKQQRDEQRKQEQHGVVQPTKHDTVCPTGWECLGLGCRLAGTLAARSTDGSASVREGTVLWFDPRRCRECRCRPAPWPWRNCSLTILATRERHELLGLGHSTGSPMPLGFGSLLNGVLHAAAFALEHGFGFQHTHFLCPYETRFVAPFCFFAPVSACGTAVREICHRKFCDASAPPPNGEYGPAPWHPLPNRRRLCSAFSWNATAERECAASDISMWRAVGRLVLQLQPEIQDRIDALANAQLDRFQKPRHHPRRRRFAAMHVRRSDKVIEAKSSAACEYASALEELLYRHSEPAEGWTVYVATDEPEVVLPELQSCPEVRRHQWSLATWANESIGSNEAVETSGHVPDPRRRGYGADVVMRLWTEVTLLKLAAFAVLTFSSNIGRLVQVVRAQPADTVASLDGEGRSGEAWRCPERFFCG